MFRRLREMLYVMHHPQCVAYQTDLENRIKAALTLHRRSTFAASSGEDRGKHYCVTCTMSIDDQTVYALWPCPTAKILEAQNE